MGQSYSSPVMVRVMLVEPDVPLWGMGMGFAGDPPTMNWFGNAGSPKIVVASVVGWNVLVGCIDGEEEGSEVGISDGDAVGAQLPTRVDSL